MKKFNSNIAGLLIAILVSIASLWIYNKFIQKRSYVLIDNPTQANLKIKIDHKDYVMAPYQQIEINLAKGEHQMSATSDVDSIQLPLTNFRSNSNRAILNPTKATYFIYGLPYGVNVNSDSIFTNTKIKYQNKIYNGDLQIDSALYIDSFYYNLNENYPKVTLKSENTTLRKKDL